MMRSRIPNQTASSEQSPFLKALKKGKAFETVVYPSASMEAKGVIPEEAWSDHCLHTERVYKDRRRCTFSVAPRHRDFIKNMTTDALHADMTLIMVCVITRQTVHRETIVRATGDVKVKLSTTYERCVPLLVEAWLPMYEQRPREDRRR